MALLSFYLSDVQNPERVADRFWRRVDKTGECWLWQGCVADGRGRFTVDALGRMRLLLAHRAAYLLTYGFLPPTSLCHRCDNPLCVRPEHLFTCTQADNVRDMWRKGRAADGSQALKGSRHPEAKLTEEQVMAMRAAYRSGVRQRELALQFGVSIQSVASIVQRRGWRHVP